MLQGWRTCAVTTLGRGGSDLTATTIGKALGLREIQVSQIDFKCILPRLCGYLMPIELVSCLLLEMCV